MAVRFRLTTRGEHEATTSRHEGESDLTLRYLKFPPAYTDMARVLSLVDLAHTATRHSTILKLRVCPIPRG